MIDKKRVLLKIKWWSEDLTLFLLLISGILLRIIVFFFQSPFNNDDHLSVIQYIVTTGMLPTSDLMLQSYHPPLYYLIGTGIFYFESIKLLQALSLVFSILTLGVFFILLKKQSLFPQKFAQRFAFSLVCFLPQFIIFGNFISNDSLSYLLGALTFLFALKYTEQRKTLSLITLACILGIGLLTKSTFLVFIIPLSLLIIILGLKDKLSQDKIWVILIIFLFIVTMLGGYKFAENSYYQGNPFYNNLDLTDSLNHSQSFIKEISSIINLDITTLINQPTFLPQNHSASLIYYATFWYSYIPESNFKGNEGSLKWLGPFIYITAILPTLIVILGAGSLYITLWRAFRKRKGISAFLSLDTYTLFKICATMIFFFSLLLVFIVGIKYNTWSVFQARLTFASLFAVTLFFSEGLLCIKNHKLLLYATFFTYILLLVLFLTYFICEIFLVNDLL